MRFKWMWIFVAAALVFVASCASATTIGEAKAAGVGWSGYLQGFVTAVFPDYGCMVIEESNRSAAIIVRPMVAYQIGVELSIQGTIQSDGTFRQTTVNTTGFTQSVFPVAMSNKAMTGIVGNAELSTTELLVTTWGKVLDYRTTYPDGSIRFHISDGTAQAGGPTVTLPVGVIQQVSADAVQVTIPPAAAAAYHVIPGNYVKVTGIAGKGDTLSGDLREVMIVDSSQLSRIPVGGEVIDRGIYPPVIVAQDSSGDYGPLTPGTTTSGLQEAVSYCVGHNRNLYIRGPAWYGISTTLTIPAARRFTMEGGNYGIAWVGSASAPDDCIVIDSAKDCHYRMGLLVGPENGTGAVIKIKPQHAIPNDGTTAFTDSDLRLECSTGTHPFDPGTRYGTGVYFDTSGGPITYNDFFLIAVINLATQIFCPDTGQPFAYNRLECGHLHTNAVNSTLLHIGAMCYQNYFRIAQGVDQQDPTHVPVTGVIGIDIFGCNNELDVASRNGWLEPNKELIFEPSAAGNVVRYASTNIPLDLITDLATNPTNLFTWAGATAPAQILTSISTGTFTYTQRLYPAVVRITGGAVTNIVHKRGGDSIVYGAATPLDVFMSPGDNLDITNSTAPTVYVVPM